MDLNWLDPQHLGDRDVAGAVALLEANRRLEVPFHDPPTPALFRAEREHGWDGDPARAAVYREDGRVVALLTVHLPTWDNRHSASVGVLVDPQHRRHGIGRKLFEVGEARAREAGRTVLFGDAWTGTPGIAFLKAMGLNEASTYVRRGQDLTTVDWAALPGKIARAQQRAADYEVVRMPGRIPDDLMDRMVAMTEAINDAPTDELKVEDEVFSAERLRAFETAQAARQRRLYHLVARHRATGELAGHTLVAVAGSFPWGAEQLDTSVLRAHRGHRLGLLLKASMLAWLREAEPQLRVVHTFNAASNQHMIAVNEELGYRILATGVEFQKDL